MDDVATFDWKLNFFFLFRKKKAVGEKKIEKQKEKRKKLKEKKS